MLFNKKIINILLLFCICDKFFLKEDSNEKLLFVLEHFRHGARGAYKLFDYKNWKDLLKENWKGPGELTSLGMRQHYLLGKSVRNKYKNFVANLKNEFKMYTQNEREIYNKIVKLSSKNQMINKEQTLSFRERDSLEFGY